jgi:microcin C transport system ATP-binding protein
LSRSGSGVDAGLAILVVDSQRRRIRFQPNRWRDESTSSALRLVQVVFQDPFGSLSPRMSVCDIVGEGLRIHKMGTPVEREAA